MAASNVLTQVKNIVSKTLKIALEKLDVEADFDSFGIDSIIAMELMSNLSKGMNISITPAQFTEVNTIKELAEAIEELTSESESIPEVEVKEEVQKVVAPRPKPTTVNTPTRRTLRKREQAVSRRSIAPRKSENPHKNVLDKIQQEFAIDLSYRKFNSIEDIADTLINSHLDELLSHYNLVDNLLEDTVYHEEDVYGNELQYQEGGVAYDDIAIVGVSCNFPDAPNAGKYWENLLGQKNSIREIPETRWDWKQYYSENNAEGKTNSKWAALIENHDCFDAKFFNIDEEEAKLMDPQERLLLQEVYKSFQDAGINPNNLKNSKTGIFTSYEYSEYEHYLRTNVAQLDVANKPFFSSSSPTYYLSNRLSFLFDFNGPSETYNVNCAGSAVAINRAYQSLQNGESDVAVVGGVSLNLFAEDYIALSKYDMLSPDGTCGVFDDNANGFTRGEGAASVVLKRLSDAERDQDKIYAVIKSSHQNNRGNARFLQEIDTESITDVIANCYENAGIEPTNVHYIEVDGYATKWADSFEYEGVKKVFEKATTKEKSCALGSLKGNIGNLESVNGLASFIKLALSLHHKKFPASITKHKVNSFIDIDNPKHPLYIADKEISFDAIRSEQDTVIRAGINSFADTGVNVHILLEEYTKTHRNLLSNNSEPQIFVLSAKDQNRLLQSVKDYISFIATADEATFENTIYTLQTGREAMEERLAVIASSFKELLSKLTTIKNGFSKDKTALEKKGIFYGAVNKTDANPLMGIFTDDMTKTFMNDAAQKDRMHKLANLWIAGFDVTWNSLWDGKKVQPVSLPLYPFYKTRYWAEVIGNVKPIATTVTSEKAEVSTASTAAQEIVKEWFFYISDKENTENTFSVVEKIELYLQQEIASILKMPVQDVDKTKNFLELGLSSINIGTFVSNTMNLLGVTMSPAIIFNNPEINSLALYLCDTFPQKVQHVNVTKDAKKAAENKVEVTIDGAGGKALIPLQIKGRRKPIFAVSPGGNGTTLSFQYLVKALGYDQPFYGLELVMGKNTNPADISITSIATANVQEIQEVQPKGPYRLMGLSNGGMIAFEMAKILLEKGEKVTFLGFLDCFSPSQKVIDMVDEIVGVFNGKFTDVEAANLDIDVEALKKMSEEKRFDYLYEVISKQGFTIPKQQFETTYNIARAMDMSCRAYQPETLETKVNAVLFRATKGYMDGYENLSEDYGWNAFLAEKIKITSIEADHFSITDQAASEKVAEKMASIFKRPQREKATS